MTWKKPQDNDLEGVKGEIKLALHEHALNGGNEKKTTRGKYSGSDEERIRLCEKMKRGKASIKELVYLSLLFGMITEAEYADYLQIEKEFGGDDNEDS